MTPYSPTMSDADRRHAPKRPPDSPLTGEQGAIDSLWASGMKGRENAA